MCNFETEVHDRSPNAIELTCKPPEYWCPIHIWAEYESAGVIMGVGHKSGWSIVDACWVVADGVEYSMPQNQILALPDWVWEEIEKVAS